MLVVNIVLVVFFVWLIVLTIGLFFVLPFFYKLSKQGGEPDLKKVLERLLKEEADKNKTLKNLTTYVNKIEKDASFHIQKIGIVRYNPFSETGGDHSFSLALLDGRLDGFIITGLHTRERTRIYLKPINKAKSEMTLSLEENKAIEKALKN